MWPPLDTTAHSGYYILVAELRGDMDPVGSTDGGETPRLRAWHIPQCSATMRYKDNNTCTAMAMAQTPTPQTRHIDI